MFVMRFNPTLTGMLKHFLPFFLALFVAQSHLMATTHDKEAVAASDLIVSELIARDSEYKLLFFGYAGCYHFCDPRLRQIDPIYKALKKILDIKVLFVDISEESSLNAAKTFVQDVNREFEAIHPNKVQMKKLQKRFEDLFIQKMPDGEYVHSGSLYLLKRHDNGYVLQKIYLEFINSEGVVQSIKKIINK